MKIGVTLTLQSCGSLQHHETAEVLSKTSRRPRFKYSFFNALSDLTILGTLFQLGKDLGHWNRCGRAIRGSEHLQHEKKAILVGVGNRASYIASLILLATSKSKSAVCILGGAIALIASALFMIRAGMESDSL